MPQFLPSRRSFLAQAGGGFGALALASLLNDERASAARPAKSTDGPKPPHFAPRAKRVIWLFMHGGPSHVDLFDPKPDLIKYAGQPLPESVRRGDDAPQGGGESAAGRRCKPLRPRGESGLEISDFLPHIAAACRRAVRAPQLHGDSVNHPQSVYQMNTGSILMGQPSVGSWVAYGLGTENRDLPAFVVLPDPGGGLKGGPPAWGSGYLPATYQGVTMRPGAQPILHLQPQPQISRAQQRATLDLVRQLNREHLAARDSDDELAARIEAYELAFRMQSAAPDLVDLKDETPETLELYGIDDKETDEFGTRCLLARRMIERGVRFVQLYSGDTNGWDAHNDVLDNHTQILPRDRQAGRRPAAQT